MTIHPPVRPLPPGYTRAVPPTPHGRIAARGVALTTGRMVTTDGTVLYGTGPRIPAWHAVRDTH